MADRYWVGGAGTWVAGGTTKWSATSGGASGASVPTSADSVFFDSASGTPGSVTMTGALTCLDITVTVTGWSFGGTGTLNVAGNLSLATGTTYSTTGLVTFSATTSKTIYAPSYISSSTGVTFNGVGGTWTLTTSTIFSATTTLTNGTLDLNGFTLRAVTRFATAAGTKNLTFNGGILELPGTVTTFNNVAPTGFTTTAGLGQGYITLTGSGAAFVGGGSVFNCILYLNPSGTAIITISGSNTFDDIQNTGSQTVTLRPTAGTTTTFRNYTLGGDSGSGNRLLINSNSTGQFTFSAAVGIVIAKYTTFSQCVVTGGALWYAPLPDNINGGGNTGWIFANPPTLVGGGISVGPGIKIGP